MRFPLNWLHTVILLAALVPALQADAQAWLSDRARTEGNGIRLGDIELHPGIGAEGGFDSNVFLASPDEGERSSGVLRISPHFYVNTRDVESGPPPVFKLRAGVNSNFKHYFFGPKFDNTVGVGQDLQLTINEARPFSAELRETFRLTMDPFTEAGAPAATRSGSGEIADDRYARYQLSVGPHFQLQTPGGLLKAGIGYDYNFDFFGTEFDNNDNVRHDFSGTASWEFLPKTAIFWRTKVGLLSYTDDRPSLDVERNDAVTLHSMLGLNGALTSKVSFTLAAGYGAGFVDPDPITGADNDYENVQGQAEIRWKPTTTIATLLAYEREITSAFQGNSATLDRIKAQLQTLFGGTFLLALRGELTFVDFGRDDLVAARDPDQANRSDIHLLTNLSGEYRFADWLAATAELSYIQNFTDYEITLTDSAGDPVGTDQAKYRQIQAWLGIRGFL